MRRYWDTYYVPKSITEALGLLLAYDGKAPVLAGGTDLILEIHEQERRVPAVVDITSIPDLDYVALKNGELVIGACSTLSTVARSSLVKEVAPHLVEAINGIGSRQIRNVATLVGNVASASPAADGLPPLLTLDCMVDLESVGGRRVIPLTRFLTGPHATDCRPGELVVALHIPIQATRASSVFQRVGLRRAMTIAVASVAVSLSMKDRKVETARIALGSVAPTAIRALAAEESLVGLELSPGAMSNASGLAAEAASPIDDSRASADYRRKMVRGLTLRGLRRIQDAYSAQDTTRQ